MSLDLLREHCLDCRACGLHRTRTNVVFGVGNPRADLMFVGEGPGEQEDRRGEPFVGRAGQLFDLYLDAFGLSRAEVYIANIVKCRPPGNRDPLPEEEQACMPYLEEQIRLIAPRLLVCLGRIAAMRLIRSDFKITREHGLWFDWQGIPITATLHPAALLRNPAQKPLCFEDFKSILQRYRALQEGQPT
ncbi:MAG: uracil-DNA glycosylase [Clostridiales bacterium]|nr:uracil-DNA glycosylase [Clostridiales bacterium]